MFLCFVLFPFDTDGVACFGSSNDICSDGAKFSHVVFQYKPGVGLYWECESVPVSLGGVLAGSPEAFSSIISLRFSVLSTILFTLLVNSYATKYTPIK